MDDDGIFGIFGIIIGLVVILFILYIIFLIATTVIGIAAACGTVYGGGTAIVNYVSSINENIIKSNIK